MELIRNLSVLKRMLLWFFSITAVIFATLFSVGWDVRETIREHSLNHINNILHHRFEKMEMYADENYANLNTLKQLIYFASRHHPISTQEFWDRSPEDLDRSLADIAEKSGFHDIFIITTKGEIVYTVKQEDDLYKNLLDGAYRDTELARVYLDALQNAKPYISDYDYYEPSHDFAAFIAEPIVDNGKIVGVLAVQIDNKKIQAFIADDTELGETGKIIATFMHAGQQMTAAPVRHSNIKAFEKTAALTIGSQQGRSGKAYIMSRPGVRVAAAWGYQKDFRMNIAVMMDEKELLNVWYSQFVRIFFLFSFGVIVVAWMLMKLLRSFSEPIGRLEHYATEISQGKYDAPIETHQYDLEWQHLIHSFQTMATDIKEKIALLNQQNISLAEQKKEIEELNQNLEERIKIASGKLQEYIDTVDRYVMISRTDRDGAITYASEAFCQMSGYRKEELIGKNHRILRHPDMPDEIYKDLWETITAGKLWHGVIKNRKSDGGEYWVDMTISPDINGWSITGYTAVRQDITDHKRIEKMSITDSMTGLYNRRHYVQIIHDEMNRVKRHHSNLALMMIDVDNFKLYNDTYGHQAGDEVLTRVGGVLNEYTSRSGEYAFRLGGEEFGVVVSSTSEEECADLGERIRAKVEAMAIPHLQNTPSDHVTVSIGIALYEGDSQISCDELYKAADRQLYIAKERGRNQVIMGETECLAQSGGDG